MDGLSWWKAGPCYDDYNWPWMRLHITESMDQVLTRSLETDINILLAQVISNLRLPPSVLVVHLHVIVQYHHPFFKCK